MGFEDVLLNLSSVWEWYHIFSDFYISVLPESLTTLLSICLLIGLIAVLLTNVFHISFLSQYFWQMMSPLLLITESEISLFRVDIYFNVFYRFVYNPCLRSSILCLRYIFILAMS